MSSGGGKLRIIIADDEQYVRYGVQSILSEVRPADEVVGAAKTGEELVELCAEKQPDVALVDVRMPGGDGLWAISEGKRLTPDTVWIILTSYPEFDYAKRAVELGALEYLLKPIAPRELEQSLTRAAEAVHAAHARKQERFEREMVALFHRTDSLAPPDEPTGAAEYAATLLLAAGARRADELSAAENELCADVRSRVGAILGRRALHGLVGLGDGVFVSVSRSLRKSAAQIREDYLSAVSHAVRLNHGAEFTVEAVMLPRCTDARRLAEVVAEARALAPFRHCTDDAPVVELSALRGLSKRLDEEVAGLCARLDELPGLLSAGRIVDAVTLVETFSRDAAARLASEASARAGVAQFLAHAVGYTPQKALAETWPGDLLRDLRETYGAGDAAAGGRGDALTREAMRFAERNFHRDIGVAETARHLGVTPNYLSGVFHRHAGRTFVDYLRSVRLEHARRLLTASSECVSEIARKVGYRDPRHFSRLFRERYGRSPDAFRRGSSENHPTSS